MPFNYLGSKEDYKFVEFDLAEAEQKMMAVDDIKIKLTVEQLDTLKKVLEDDGSGADKTILKKFKQSMVSFAAQSEEMIEEPLENNHWRGVRGTEMLVYYPRAARTADIYEDHTEGPGWLNFYNIKDLLARFFVTVHANEGKVQNWRGLCIGITSLDPEQGHLPMFDYDGKNIKTRVKKEVKELQKQFGLGDATIYETRRGLHVYFFSNIVAWDQYQAMLEVAGCCKGFKKSTIKNGYAVLRVSAKYTEFDIFPYKVIISHHRGENRPGRKAAMVRELLRLGQECGTHFASLYPQWAAFRQDVTPWRAGGNKGPLRRVKKISKADYVKKKAADMEKRHIIKTEKYKMAYNAPQGNQWLSSTTTSDTATVTYSNNTVEWTIK